MTINFDCLLVIDFQTNYIGTIRPQFNSIVNKINELIEIAIKNKLKIIFIQDPNGGDLYSEFEKINYENKIIISNKPSYGAFYGTNLSNLIKNENKLLICGLFASVCCLATTRQAINNNYQVIISKQAIEDSPNNKHLNKSIKEYKEIGCEIIS